LHEANDGGLLATIMVVGFKGELNRFQPGVRMEIFRLDAWFFKEDLLINPTNYIVKGLNRRCFSLAKTGNLKDHRDALVELVSSSEYGILHLFSHHQLQEFLLIERECSLHTMEYEEELSVINSQQE
ncbi:nuclear pore complex protein NUP107-like, partial [Zingiber officinale]|uniref:nuclear pore complex protein NUP107-like n=1 Tax=Zingiber officinale TaxID=94328 RepID=UPI001C4C7D27